MYIHAYIYTYICMYICIHGSHSWYMHIFIYIYIFTCVYIYTWQQFVVDGSTLILPAAGIVPAWLADGDFQVQVPVYIYVYTYIHIHIFQKHGRDGIFLLRICLLSRSEQMKRRSHSKAEVHVSCTPFQFSLNGSRLAVNFKSFRELRLFHHFCTRLALKFSGAVVHLPRDLHVYINMCMYMHKHVYIDIHTYRYIYIYLFRDLYRLGIPELFW